MGTQGAALSWVQVLATSLKCTCGPRDRCNLVVTLATPHLESRCLFSKQWPWVSRPRCQAVGSQSCPGSSQAASPTTLRLQAAVNSQLSGLKGRAGCLTRTPSFASPAALRAEPGPLLLSIPSQVPHLTCLIFKLWEPGHDPHKLVKGTLFIWESALSFNLKGI